MSDHDEFSDATINDTSDVEDAKTKAGEKTDAVKDNGEKTDHAECATEIVIDPSTQSLVKNLSNDKETHSKLVKKLSPFSERELISRREIVSLIDTVAAYTELKDIEVNLVRNLDKFLSANHISEEQAETSVLQITKPSEIDSLLEVSGKVLENSLNKFKKIKTQFPDEQQVLDHLDFVQTQASNPKTAKK